MSKSPNFLFVMCDQLRADYLSCYGHPHLNTPNIDSLAANGVKFTNAYCQAPLCGPSRASFYTGRYVSSHGAMINDDPLKPGELTMADYLDPHGYRTALVGKTHTFYSRAAFSRADANVTEDMTKRLACGGFEPYEVHEGLYPDPIKPKNLGYNDYLADKGYQASNPWQEFANSHPSGEEVLDGWLLENNHLAANIKEEHSETAFVTDRAIDFVQETGDQPWCLHLSYIKPHWPLVAPAPYHNMYSSKDVVAPVRSKEERETSHPVFAAFMKEEYSQNYSKDSIREHVIPTYMGLVKQIDDHLGRLFKWLKENDHHDNTIVVFTSDHGDYLGDHWLGEKDLFHECSSRIPFIIFDPRSSADNTRGREVAELVGAVDVLPTLLQLSGIEPCIERIEGQSLTHHIEGSKSNDNPLNKRQRDFIVSEIDFSDRGVRERLELDPLECRGWMLRDQNWKFIFYEGFPCQLFDLKNDPNELTDLGHSEAHRPLVDMFKERLFGWLRRRKIRTEIPHQTLLGMGPKLDESYGIIIGRWS